MATGRSETDDLLRKVAKGDRTAFDRLYTITSPQLFALGLRILPERQDAEEALQDAYGKIWMSADRFDPEIGSAMVWLITIARNEAIDRRRRLARQATSRREVRAVATDPALGSAPSAHTPERALITSSEAARLRDCLSELPMDRADAIRRAYFSGETYAEMAVATGRPEGTLKSWVRRSLATLRDCLEREGGAA